MEVVFVVFLILFSVKGTTENEIIVSQTSASTDNVNCGISSIPCKTLKYAMSLTRDGDILSIDGGKSVLSPYWYYVEAVIAINHSISIRKRYLNNASLPNPYIILSKATGNNYIFNCYKNISITGITFYTTLSITSAKPLLVWFYLAPTEKIISLTNCTFKGSGVITTDEEFLKSETMIVINVKYTKILNTHYLIQEKKIFVIGNVFTVFQMVIFNNKYVINNTSLSDGRLRAKRELIIQNSSFQQFSINVFSKTISIKNSIFFHSIIYNFGQHVEIIQCKFDNSPVFFKHIEVGEISDTIFKNFQYETKPVSALTLKITPRVDKKIIIVRCTFTNNTLKKDVIAVISIINLTPQIQKIYIQLIDSKFIGVNNKESTIFYSNSKVVILRNFSINCASGNSIKTMIQNHFLIAFLFRINCISCKKGSYNLYGEKGILSNSHRPGYNMNLQHKTGICYKCPPSGVCENGKIRAKGAHWGRHNKTVNTIEFLPCPTHYCCPSFERCISYNTCANNRQGRLCSDCIHGFSTSLNGNYQCVLNEQCDNSIIGFLLIMVFSTVWVLILLYLKEMQLFVKRRIQTKQPVRSNISSSSSDEIDNFMLIQEKIIHMPHYICRDPVVYQVIISTADIKEETYRQLPTLMFGSIKIMFFFYQASSIIRIQSPDKLKFIFPRFFDFLSTFFSVKIDISFSSLPFCFLPNLSVTQTELIKLSVICVILLFVIIIWLLAYCYNKFFHRKILTTETTRRTTFSIIDDDVPRYCTMPMITRIKCAYLQLLLIGFSSIATFSFNAVYCVNINNNLYLYQQASIQCYQPWQYFVACFIAVWVIPFCIVLYIGSKLLYHCKITTNQFLTALTFPPAMLPLTVRSMLRTDKRKLSESDAMTAKHLLLVINEPFKKSSNKDGSRMCWESILILRRMLLIVMKTFIISPITKLFPMAMLLLVFKLQHLFVAPFSDPKLNKLELIILNVLLTFVIVNIFWAVSREYDLMANPSYELLGKLLLYYEMFILAFPFILLVLCFIFYIFKKCFAFSKNYLRNRLLLLQKQD